MANVSYIGWAAEGRKVERAIVIHKVVVDFKIELDILQDY